MSIATIQLQWMLPVINGVGSLQGAGKLVPRVTKHGHRSARVTSDLDESMMNALANCTELGLVRVTSPLLRPAARPLPAHWRESHVAPASFLAGQQPPSPSPARSPLLQLRLGQHGQHQLQQRRGFKSERTLDMEQLRTPTLANQMREALQLGGQRRAEPALASVIAAPAQKNVAEGKFKELSDKSASPEEQQRLKLAFAEGYLSGGDRKSRSGSSTFVRALLTAIKLTAVIAIGYLLLSGPANNMFRIQFQTNEVMPEEVDVTFADVRGADEAKQELEDIVEYLREPERFESLGGKLPKGVLLAGPPGTGKTLLARAVAGEANVPFFHAAGSEFDEIFVGQGARRVRDLFRNAKARAPCVLFIDEIDSVGGKRSASRHHPYANQTINQLLTEMDGFHSNEGVIVLGATNRPDHLDAALLRPGRFDVQVHVSAPDLQGRKDIFRLYLSKVTLGTDLDVDTLARGTIGFTGADIENMVNQAALRAAILQASSVCMKHLDWARDKVLMGAERKARLPDEETNRTTAYHEGGHTLVAHFTKDADPVHKVTIMPRNQSLGHTSQIPAKDQFQNTRAQIVARMDVLMGGRAAEEIIFGPEQVTTGAGNDLERATKLATSMVKHLGMSERMGLRTISDGYDPETGTNSPPTSDNTKELIDVEIKRLLNESYERAKTLLKTHHKELKLLAEALLKYETLDAEDVKAIVRGDYKPDKASSDYD